MYLVNVSYLPNLQVLNMKKYEQRNHEKEESESKSYKSEILNQYTTEMKAKARNLAKDNKHFDK